MEVCTNGGKPCIFPFIDNGKTYYNCTEPGGRQNRPWCAETVNEKNEWDKWDYCDWDNLDCGMDSTLNDSILIITFKFYYTLNNKI